MGIVAMPRNLILSLSKDEVGAGLHWFLGMGSERT